MLERCNQRCALTAFRNQISIAQRRIRFADRLERNSELRPSRRGALDESERPFIGMPRQSGARKPAADVFPEDERAFLPSPANGEP